VRPLPLKLLYHSFLLVAILFNYDKINLSSKGGSSMAKSLKEQRIELEKIEKQIKEKEESHYKNFGKELIKELDIDINNWEKVQDAKEAANLLISNLNTNPFIENNSSLESSNDDNNENFNEEISDINDREENRKQIN